MEYGTGKNDAIFRKTGNEKCRMIALSIFTLVFLLFGFFYRSTIVDFFLPGDPIATRKAINVFVGQLKEGEKTADAFAAFCKVIVDEAHVS